MESIFRKILLCSDGSACAKDAAGTAASIAQLFNSEVLALNVFQTPYVDPAGIGVWAIAIEQDAIDRCASEQLKWIEEDVQPLLKPLTTPWHVIQKQGHPVDAILQVAKHEKVDLIVIGSRGLRGVKELLLGSVSSGVLHHATCPVLIVHGDKASSGTANFRSILLASDGSPCAQKAACVAVDLAQKCETSLTVLNVYEELSSVCNPGDEDTLTGDSFVERNAKQWLDYVERPVRDLAEDAGVACSFVQAGGRPDEAVVSFAGKHNVDLIVLGSRGLGGYARMLIGSVSNRVVHHANCPVLVVP